MNTSYLKPISKLDKNQLSRNHSQNMYLGWGEIIIQELWSSTGKLEKCTKSLASNIVQTLKPLS